MLSLALPLQAAALGALSGGAAAAPWLGFLGLAVAAAFVALLGGFAKAEPAPDPGWTAGLDRRAAALCAAAFFALSALAAALAWQVWHSQGPARALGLAAVALAFAAVAASCGGRALRR